MHRRKTGALIECSVLLGALAAGVTGGGELAALQRFGAEIGLAFQIQDDILDVDGRPAPARQGHRRGRGTALKPTYPSAAGLPAARAPRAASCAMPRSPRSSRWARAQPRSRELADFVVSRAS